MTNKQKKCSILNNSTMKNYIYISMIIYLSNVYLPEISNKNYIDNKQNIIILLVCDFISYVYLCFFPIIE